MNETFIRTEMLLGESALLKLRNSHVAVFGVGGVGGAVVEALSRCGVGTLTLVDHDAVSESNINRQIIALRSTIGRRKVDVFKERIADINEEACVFARACFFDSSTKDEFDFSRFDYVVDAVDTVTAKLLIIEMARTANVPVISAMGAGNKLNPQDFEVSDIKKTSVCPLARVMRRELKARGIDSLKVVYSKEPPVLNDNDKTAQGQKRTPGSVSFVPPAAGYIIAGEVIKDLCGIGGH